MALQPRIEAVRRRMSADGIDILIAASGGLHALDRADAVAYLTGYRSVGESVFLLRSDGAATLIASPAADSERLAAQYAASTALATNDIVGAAQSVLAAGAPSPGRTAVSNLASLPYQMARRLLAIAGNTARNFDDVLYAIHPHKTNSEIERARKATAIAEKGYERLLEIARPGMPECALATELNLYTSSLGAEDNFLMLSAAPQAHAVMPSSSRRIEYGDLLLVEISPNYAGQFSQICRSVSIGSPTVLLRQKYDLVLRAMWAGIEAVRPGIPVSEVCRAIDRVLAAAGYAEYCRPPHMRRRGHGLGCGSVAPGDIAVENHTPLEEGMGFVVHPNQYIPEVGYLLCGEPVRVTATGAETLSAAHASLGVIGADSAQLSGLVPCD